MTTVNEVSLPDANAPDKLVPDPKVAKEFGISAMGIWRWERDPDLGFPPAIVIRKRKFRSRRQLEAFKQSLVQRAMRERSKMRDESTAATDRPVARRPRVGGRHER
jgi:hypothetical protein